MAPKLLLHPSERESLKACLPDFPSRSVSVQVEVREGDLSLVRDVGGDLKRPRPKIGIAGGLTI